MPKKRMYGVLLLPFVAMQVVRQPSPTFSVSAYANRVFLTPPRIE